MNDNKNLEQNPPSVWQAEPANPQNPPPVPEAAEATEPEEGGKSGKPSQAEVFCSLVNDHGKLFHTPAKDPFARIEEDGHEEVWPVRSGHFRSWIFKLFYDLQGKPPNNQALQDALRAFEASAIHRGEEEEVFVRYARHDGSVYVDLANRQWEQVRITRDGWAVIPAKNSPVRFKRTEAMKPLARPVQGGSLEGLRDFLNLETEHEWVLSASWLIGAINPDGPFTILLLQGEQGTAKSTTARLLADLIDPSEASLRTLPRGERDLAIAASRSWVLNFDNLSGLQAWTSDALCRLATGGGFATRKLYTDEDEAIFKAKRPIIMNGISDIATRHDLADRSLTVMLPPIPEEKRRPEKVLWTAWEQAKPGILGALYNAVSMALRNEAHVELATLPRMADFATWVTAAEPALPWAPGTFLKEYAKNRASLVDTAIEADPFATAILRLVEEQANKELTGTATGILTLLRCAVGEQDWRQKHWPKAANALSNRLRRNATFMRAKGYLVEDFRSGGQRFLTIRRDPEKTAQTAQTDRGGREGGWSYEPIDDEYYSRAWAKMGAKNPPAREEGEA